MALRIEPAKMQDLHTIVRLVKELAAYERLADEAVASEEDFRRALFGADRHVDALLAFIDDEAVGFALYFSTFSTFLGKRGLYLEDIFVEDEHRGRGIGTALLKRLGRIAKQQGCGRIEWSVLTWNRPSIDFYHRMGAVTLEDWRMFRITGPALEALAE